MIPFKKFDLQDVQACQDSNNYPAKMLVNFFDLPAVEVGMEMIVISCIGSYQTNVDSLSDCLQKMTTIKYQNSKIVI
jgi:hypothetical protein